MSDVSRRQFVGLGLAAGASVAVAGIAGCSSSGSRPGSGHAPARSTDRPDPADRRRIVVVGAGFAGLACALDLVDLGWDVTVVEARERVGGRVMTFRGKFAPGLHAEAGGESIDDNHSQILALVKRFGLATEKREANKYERGVVYRGGQRTAITSLLTLRNGKVAADYGRANDAITRLSAGVDPDHPDRAANAEQLDRQNFAQFLDELYLDPDAQFLMGLGTASEYNCDLRQLSMLFVAQQNNAAVAMGSGESETMRITGGNDALATKMAAALGQRLHLGQPIDRIEHTRDGVRVGANGRFYTGAQVVLAVPMPPLRKVTFAPALPSAAAAMIAAFDLGDAAKVVTEYQTPFWRTQGLSGFSLTDEPFRATWDATDSYAAQQGLLTNFITGPYAREVSQKSAADRIAEVEAQTAKVYPEGVSLRTGKTATQAWPAEPFTGGGYSLFQPGQVTQFWPLLQAPTGTGGRIHFAGEHTEALSGFMESAIRSGQRVAKAIGKAPPA